jgi:drug/metabolite transporter (DMT)-like permease
MLDAIDYPLQGRSAEAASKSKPALILPVRVKWAAPGALAFLVILLGNDWGLQYSAAKLMANEGVHAIGSLYAMHLVLVAVFSVILFLRHTFYRLRLKHLIFFAVIGALSNVGQLGSELIAAQHVSAGELALINALMPLFTVALVMTFRTEPLSRAKCAALFLGLAAAIAIILPEALAERPVDLAWTLFAFISPVSSAIAAVVMAYFWPPELDVTEVAAGSVVAGAAWLTPMVLLSGAPVTLTGETTAATFGTLLFLATVGVEFYLMALITRLGGAVFASCSDFIAVCAGLFWGFVFFTEIPTGWTIAAAMLCLAALKLAANHTAAEREVAALSD